MLKALAVLRTLFLFFIVGYLVVRGTLFQVSEGEMVSYLRAYQHGAWYAVAWIAFDTVVSWLIASRPRKVLPPAEAPIPPGAPPFQPPPHR